MNLKEIRLKKGLTQQQVANELGIKPTTYSGYETGYSKPDIDKLIQLSDFLEVTIDYLVGHTSEMIIEEDKGDYQINHKGKGVPYYDVDFVGGFDLVFGDQTIQPSFFIDFAPFNNSDAWINVTGTSMYPMIGNGDLVALKKMNGNQWKEFLLFGEIYAIITEDFRTIKIIGKGKDDKHFNLIPHNKSPEFPEQQIPINIIKCIFQVKGSIKKFS